MPRSGHDKARSGGGASGSQFHFIDWPQQELLFNELTLHSRHAGLFKDNTGMRVKEICSPLPLEQFRFESSPVTERAGAARAGGLQAGAGAQPPAHVRTAVEGGRHGFEARQDLLAHKGDR
jgi:hypothetical protein